MLSIVFPKTVGPIVFALKRPALRRLSARRTDACSGLGSRSMTLRAL